MTSSTQFEKIEYRTPRRFPRNRLRRVRPSQYRIPGSAGLPCAAKYYTDRVAVLTSGTTQRGTGKAFSTVPPSVAVNFLIRYR